MVLLIEFWKRKFWRFSTRLQEHSRTCNACLIKCPIFLSVSICLLTYVYVHCTLLCFELKRFTAVLIVCVSTITLDWANVKFNRRMIWNCCVVEIWAVCKWIKFFYRPWVVILWKWTCDSLHSFLLWRIIDLRFHEDGAWKSSPVCSKKELPVYECTCLRNNSRYCFCFPPKPLDFRYLIFCITIRGYENFSLWKVL